MSQVVFMPGFDGDASLRAEFVHALAEGGRSVRSVSYPPRVLGTLDAYREHAMASVPVDWKPVLVAESFSGLVAARWAAIDSRVRGLVLCASFARNPVGYAAEIGAQLPSLVQIGPWLTRPFTRRPSDPRRRRWSDGFSLALGALPPEVVAERMRIIAAEDVGPTLARLVVPVVVVQFKGDLVIGPSERAHLERVCHNARVIRIPGPHFAIEAKPLECAEAIGAAIDSLDGTSEA